MKKILVSAVLLIGILSPAFSKKKKVKDVQIYHFQKYVSIDNESSQTKNNLTIEVVPLHPGLITKYPELFSFDINKMPADWSSLKYLYPPNPDDGRRYEYPFEAGNNSLCVFYIKITNNTNHILRMRDARIYLLAEGEDPVKATSYIGNADLLDVTPEGQSALKDRIFYPKSFVDHDETIIDQITTMYYNWDKSRKKGILHFNFPVGFPSQIILQNKKKYKLVNDVRAEILPDFTYSGILMFNRFIQVGEQISLRMYDFHTKTDEAGNVTEKTNFTFNFKAVEGTMYFDRNQKKWIVGTPPQEVEYYDKKKKKWFYGLPDSK